MDEELQGSFLRRLKSFWLLLPALSAWGPPTCPSSPLSIRYAQLDGLASGNAAVRSSFTTLVGRRLSRIRGNHDLPRGLLSIGSPHPRGSDRFTCLSNTSLHARRRPTGFTQVESQVPLLLTCNASFLVQKLLFPEPGSPGEQRVAYLKQ